MCNTMIELVDVVEKFFHACFRCLATAVDAVIASLVFVVESINVSFRFTLFLEIKNIFKIIYIIKTLVLPSILSVRQPTHRPPRLPP